MARQINESRRSSRLPLKSQHMDPQFWAKLTALWHRERMREVYVATGAPPHDARHRANREALEVARKNGWTGHLPQLKAALSELVVNELPGRGRRLPGTPIRYWEEQIHQEMMKLLAYAPARLESALTGLLQQEVARNGRFAGRTGFYKLTHIVGFTPTTDFIEKREAFMRALNAIGHDHEQADREIYRVVLRLLQTYTHRPFETRLGEPMPDGSFKSGMRRVFGFLPFRSS